MKKQIYYGEQTRQAIKNFPFPTHKVQLELIYAITEIKKAAAQTHKKNHELNESISNAIVQTCDQILAKELDDQFVTCALQGGAGTSINMNVNEVIAKKATEIAKLAIHPNDHVNKAQSTNDVNPSALKIACLKLLKPLEENLNLLIHAFETKAKEYKNVKKLARTHMQDAIPTTLGEEFQAYASILQRDKQRIQETIPYLQELNLGGTAIGNCLNASEKYREEIYRQLNHNIHGKLKKAPNLMSQTSSASDFCHLSAMINILFTDITKIATDIRFMASGPKGGIDEINLEPLQAGSSIMPGKVNPVIPEAINQIAFDIAGKNLTIHQATQNAHLELAIMFPILAENVISILKLAATGCSVFAINCIQSISANKQHCKALLENSTAYATILTPQLGYDLVSQIVKESIATKKTLKETMSKKKLIKQI
jgi:aspartate ammonia-lyase